MSEIRKVIGVFDQLVANKNGIAFPSVRVWIRGANDYETRGLEQLFPERGTVYLHVSACENQHPLRNQVGLFNCVESPGQSAAWKVNTTSKHLAKVVDYPAWESKPGHLAFWEWLAGYKESLPCNILLSQGIAYVRRGKRELIGPFAATSEGRLSPREQTFIFDGVDIVQTEISGRKYGFIDTESLPKGKPILLDPKEAIHRRLKILSRTGHLEWLSRTKVQELSNALAGITVADGSEWVMEHLPGALENISQVGRLDENTVESILQIKTVEEALALMWKRQHAETTSKAEKEIDELKKAAGNIQKAIEDKNGELAQLQSERNSLENELRRLNQNIEAARTDARKVFDEELKRLASSPESLALFAAWSSSGNKGLGTNSGLKIKVQQLDANRQKAANLSDAFSNNLRRIGLSPASASEVAIVCAAAMLSGQPVAFRSLHSDMLADAVVSALGQPQALWVDLPAGLLDPVDWESLIPDDQKTLPLILQGVNRSDVSMVLGSKRMAVSRQALGCQKPEGMLLVTLEQTREMQVQEDIEFGAIVDDRMLKFGAAKVAAAIHSFSAQSANLADIELISDEELIEVVGDEFAQLALFRTSAKRILYRRAISALKLAKISNQEICRLLYKYWILPRLAANDMSSVLESYREKWKQDANLSDLAKATTGNE
ncbi:MAG TPA: hypothetical protein VFV96_10745 [Verrucomicrobiae bacterium]|nr:hypothetical protein [Verrucomicrobiae bacterium]